MNGFRPLSVDPWEWGDMTVEEFVFHFVRDGHTGTDAQLFQFFAVQHCIAQRAEIEQDGSGFAVLTAVRECGTHSLVMPDWLVYAFNRRYDAVLNFRALSWDDSESFGRPYPKGTNRAAKRKKRVLSIAVFNDVRRSVESQPGTPIDKALFEKVGAEHAIGATLAEEYYRHAKALLQRITPAKTSKTAGLQERGK